MKYSYYKTVEWKDEMPLDELENCQEFLEIVRLFKAGTNFYFPNYKDAPWQVQCEIGDKKVNFWPHKLKAHVEYTKGGAVQGKYAVVDLIANAIADNDMPSEADGWVMPDDDDWDVIDY